MCVYQRTITAESVDRSAAHFAANLGRRGSSCAKTALSLQEGTFIYWRASLVPAAMVIPAPIAYIKVVVVKKLVVGSQRPWSGYHA